jgi:hypothetical protein
MLAVALIEEVNHATQFQRHFSLDWSGFSRIRYLALRGSRHDLALLAKRATDWQ